MREALNFYLVLVNTHLFVSHMVQVCVTSRESQMKRISFPETERKLEKRKTFTGFLRMWKTKQINKPGNKYLRNERFTGKATFQNVCDMSCRESDLCTTKLSWGSYLEVSNSRYLENSHNRAILFLYIKHITPV